MTVKKRFRIGISYVSLAVAGFSAASVQAGDAVVSTARTTPAATSRADGVAPGNLTIAPDGSIKVGSGPAVTVDSSNTFTNNGTVDVSAESQALGVHVATAGGAITGGIADNGTINIPGPAQSSTLWPAFVSNTGIEVSGANAFTGSITRGTGSTLTVGGNGATGIGILTTMNGSLQNDGAMKLGRQESFGIKATGAISGSLANGGTIEATGQESIGIYAGGGVGGSIINRGSIITGAPASTNSANESVPAVRGGRALWVASDALQIVNTGNGVTKEQEAAGLVPEGSPADGTLTVRGTAEALFIGQGGLSGNRNITINRPSSSLPSVLNSGIISTEAATLSATPVRAVNITGTAVGSTIYRTTLAGGFNNEGGDIISVSRDAVAQAIRIGDYASVPSLLNTGAILARGGDSGENADTGLSGGGGGDAYGLIIEQNGRLASLTNSGKLSADSHGVTQSAYAIVDYSGTLTSIVNSGQVIAARKGSGAAVALDLSRHTAGANVQNSGSFAGAMNFGAGADRLTSTGGILLGDVNMGAGNDTVSLGLTTLTGNLNLGDGTHTVSLNGSVMQGGLTLGTGTATLDVDASTITIPTTSGFTITNGRFRGGSTVNFNINAQDETVGAVKASGNLIVDAGTVLNATITGAVVDQFTVNLLEAQSLTMNADLGGLQPGSTVMYQRVIRLAANNPNILQYQITRRTAAQLRLTPRLGAIYDSSVEGMGQDADFSGVMAAFTDQAKFEAALETMVPDTSDAARRLAMSSRALAEGALQRRMSGFLSNRNDPLGRFRSGFWLQSLTRFGSADGEGTVPGYSLFSMGVAGGLDAQLTEQSIIGFSVTQTFGSAEEDSRPTGPVKLSTTSLDFYGRANTEFGYVQGTIGYGLNKYRQGRTVEFEGIQRDTTGSSPGYQWGATVDAGTHLVTGRTTILTAYLRGTYNNAYRHAYEEAGGGPAVDLRYDSRSYSSLRGGGGAEVERRIQFSASNALALNAHVDYAHEFNDKATSVRAHFVAGTTPFALQGMTPAKNVVSGGVGAAWERRLSTLSLDYDAEKAGPFLGHSVSLTYRQRF